MKYIVSENEYPNHTSDDRREMFFTGRGLAKESVKEDYADNATGSDYKSWMQAFCKRKYNSEFSKEMNRSVRKYLEDFSDRA